MSSPVNFDALVQNTIPEVAGTAAPQSALDELYGQLFALPTWQFIARGEMPNVTPYAASHPSYADGKPMIRAFTDTTRLQQFVRENHVQDAQGNHLVLSIPTESIIDYLEQFIAAGVYGIWFNSDTVSRGFFLALDQLRPIKQHLDAIGR